MPFDKTLSSADAVKLKIEAEAFSPKMSRRQIAKKLFKSWKMKLRTMEDWLSLVQNLSPTSLSYVDTLGKGKLSIIASADFTNPSYRDFLVEKTVEESLTSSDLQRIREFIYTGRNPIEAIEIVKGRRPEKTFNKNDRLTLGKIVKDLERAGLDWRNHAETLKLMGKIQVVQGNQLRSSILYDILSMKVAVDDMSRFIEQVLGAVPKEVMDALMAEFRSDDAQVHETPVKKETREVRLLAAPGEGGKINAGNA